MNGGPEPGGGRAAVRTRATVRTRSAVAALVAAAVCGLATGRYALPPPPGAAHPAARATPATEGTSASTSGTAGASAPAPGPSASATVPPKAATGPLTTADLVGPAAFAAVGVTGKIYARDRFGDGSYANAACTGEKTLTQTLGGPGAHFRGLMTSTRTDPGDPTVALDPSDQIAREVAAEAHSPALAQNFAQRLLLEEVPCQEDVPGHWVYGSATTVELAPDVSASWMGTYPGSLNTGGTAPEGKEPCGGIAVLRSGSHYGVLEVDACLGTAAMSRIVRTALSQL
ncbi:hypothetical protein [Streptomyces sp. NRRL F-5123]|uniref:hypothetical protein n=1 Tax=Streptomyces sp. NRRL F-5123 TaxID=1463856 RepID=UPI0004E1DBE3|nr:hypothetical protein [Streptomyces sp. NRRL F-5123]